MSETTVAHMFFFKLFDDAVQSANTASEKQSCTLLTGFVEITVDTALSLTAHNTAATPMGD